MAAIFRFTVDVLYVFAKCSMRQHFGVIFFILDLVERGL